MSLYNKNKTYIYTFAYAVSLLASTHTNGLQMPEWVSNISLFDTSENKKLTAESVEWAHNKLEQIESEQKVHQKNIESSAELYERTLTKLMIQHKELTQFCLKNAQGKYDSLHALTQEINKTMSRHLTDLDKKVKKLAELEKEHLELIIMIQEYEAHKK